MEQLAPENLAENAQPNALISPNIPSNVNHITILHLDYLLELREHRESHKPRKRPYMHVFPHLFELSIDENVDATLDELKAGQKLRSLEFEGAVSEGSLTFFLRRSEATGVRSLDCKKVRGETFDDALEEMRELEHLCIRSIGVECLNDVATTLSTER